MMDEARRYPILGTEQAASLLDSARDARKHAYAPYSGFPVGAALLDGEGRVHQGCNVENAAYPLATCAERTAIVAAVASGIRDFRAIAVVGPEGAGTCTPCGSCRQLLFEFSPGIDVWLEDSSGEPTPRVLADLLPEAFGPANLEEQR